MPLDYILPLLFFYEDGFGIKKPMKVDMPLTNQTKNNKIWLFHLIMSKMDVIKSSVAYGLKYVLSTPLIIFTQPLRLGRIWHKVDF